MSLILNIWPLIIFTLFSFQELTTKYSEELSNLQKEKDAISAEYERVKSELSSRLKAAEDEVK